MAATYPNDAAALKVFREAFSPSSSIFNSWTGDDPCNSQATWTGIFCSSDGRVLRLVLPDQGLQGSLPAAIGDLTNLEYLDLSLNMELSGTIPAEIGQLVNLISLDLHGCGLAGNLPKEIGQLRSLQALTLNENEFSGQIPATVAALSALSYFDIASNAFTGPIPVDPGLDSCANLVHLHANRNKLTTLPKELGKLKNVIHLVVNDNNIDQSFDSEIGNMTSLTIINIGNNKFSGQIPESYFQKNLIQFVAPEASLSGDLPSMGSALSLMKLDLSQNLLSGSFSELAKLRNLSEINLAGNKFAGEFPSVLTSLDYVLFLNISGNSLSGKAPDWPNLRGAQLDFSYNNFSESSASLLNSKGISLFGNPICKQAGANGNLACRPNSIESAVFQYAPNPQCSFDSKCSQGLIPNPEDRCSCSSPLNVVLKMPSTTFEAFTAEWANQLKYKVEQGIGDCTGSPDAHQVVVLGANQTEAGSTAQEAKIEIFPKGLATWDADDLLNVMVCFSARRISLGPKFGSFIHSFVGARPIDTRKKSERTKKWLIPVIIANVLLVLVLIGLIAYFLLRQKQIKKEFEVKATQNDGLVSQRVAMLSFEDLEKATNGFHESRVLGEGGYGKVYYGVLPSNEKVAIKVAKPESVQGLSEFRNEIQLLSLVNHRNIVQLVGYCYHMENNLQLLVYQYMAKGTLNDLLHPSENQGDPFLKFNERLAIALDAAHGLSYLHHDMSPPVIHRDVKSCNILIDESFVAKVADFGLSKATMKRTADSIQIDIRENAQLDNTQVMGTLGYLDPHYHKTGSLSDKSDIYSYGVVLLELVTGLKPITNKTHIIELVEAAVKENRLHSIVDIRMGEYQLDLIENIVDLAFSCCAGEPEDRPSMRQVVQVLEKIGAKVVAEEGSHRFSTLSSIPRGQPKAGMVVGPLESTQLDDSSSYGQSSEYSGYYVPSATYAK